ncbi:MAG TPA: DUF4157 domain-containing protein [Anaerolineae bacterium]|nr:DUF4157 domain-containing protein [Anaerolineae bacterium]
MRPFEQKQDQPQKAVSASLAQPDKATLEPTHRQHPILHLQRAIGNQAVQRMLQTGVDGREAGLSGSASPRSGHAITGLPTHPPTARAIQTKLQISEPGDEYEREADRIADQVMAAPSPHTLGSAPLRIQRLSGQPAGQASEAPASVNQVLASPGRPLEPALRQDMEQHFGYDFSQVRVHTGAIAEKSAEDVNALAYTVGHDVVFGSARFTAGTHDGRRLIAHELTHVVQQTAFDGVSHGNDAVRRRSDTAINPKPAPQSSNRTVLQRLTKVRNIRHLAAGERAIAAKVFKNTIPYDEVVVSDGLGGGDRPFTLPTYLRLPLFNVSAGKYVIHAGEGYYGMSYLAEDKKLLIHELTHVWQGEHSSHSWDYVVSSLWSQALTDNAYEYDRRILKQWDDYNSEQQAQIVEDWFADGMKEKQEEDRRFYYIKKHIRGEQVDEDWIAAQWIVKPLPAATLPVRFPPDPDLLPILELSIDKNDIAGLVARVKKLEDAFNRLKPLDAQLLLERLELRRPDDKVARYFHYYLSTPTRKRLIEILDKKVAAQAGSAH